MHQNSNGGLWGVQTGVKIVKMDVLNLKMKKFLYNIELYQIYKMDFKEDSEVQIFFIPQWTHQQHFFYYHIQTTFTIQ